MSRVNISILKEHLFHIYMANINKKFVFSVYRTARNFCSFRMIITNMLVEMKKVHVKKIEIEHPDVWG